MNVAWVAFNTILRKETIRFLRIWIQTLLPPIITMTLYFVVFGSFIGRRVGTMGGYDYIAYIAPGLIMMSIITNAYSNVCSSFFSAKFQRSIEEMLVAPIPNHVILNGYLLAGVLRGVLTGLLVSLVALFFTGLQIEHVGIVILVIILSALIFSLAGFINALFAKKFDDISIIPTFVLTPLTYLGGVFYSINLLPPFWRDASLLNPIVYLINIFRYGLLGVSDVDVGLSLAMLVLFTLFAYLLALWLLKRGIGIRQ